MAPGKRARPDRAPRGAGALCAALLIAMAACDPCSGVASCDSGSPHLAFSGRLLHELSGTPAAGATVDFVRTGGTALASDSVRARVNGEGLFEVRVGASDVGETVGDVVIRLPDGGGYRVPAMRFNTTSRAGEGRVLSPWTTAPQLPDLAILYRRGHPREPLANMAVEFRRTGGIQASGLDNGVYRTTTAGDGFTLLFGRTIQPIDGGDIVGDLVVDLPPFGPTFHRDVRLSAKTAFRAPSQLHQFGFGPNLEYHLAIYYRGIGEFGGGPPVRVQFRRTGGIQVTPENWEQTTDGFGRVAFFVRAHEYGVLRGDVTIIPPAPFRTYTVTDLALETYDVDGAKLYDDYGVGPGLPYYVVIRRNGTPIPGVPVGFRRTGGIELNPAEFERATNDTGIVMLTSTPAGEGEVVGDITVRSPAPHPTFVVRGVRLQAIDGDPPGGRILIGDWDVTAPPATARVERP